METYQTKKNNETAHNCNFHDHFRKLAQWDAEIDEAGKEEIDKGERENLNQNIEIESLDAPIDLNELHNAINNLKKDKAAGFDLILNEFIINATLNLKVLILAIFNNILNLEFSI